MRHSAGVCFGLVLCLTGATGFRSVKRDQSVSAVETDVGNDVAIETDAVSEVTLFNRRRRDRRRRYTAPAPTPPPTPPPCAYMYVWNVDADACCTTEVTGSWTHSRTIAMTETLTISYGYYVNYEDFDLDVHYTTSMRSARAGFKFLGFGGGASYNGYTADLVVSQTYINVQINYNLTWTATYSNSQGHYLYQWKWDVAFTGSTACQQAPIAIVLTSKLVQANSVPKCLPGTNLNSSPDYQACENVATAATTAAPPPPRRRAPPRRRRYVPPRRRSPPRRRYVAPSRRRCQNGIHPVSLQESDDGLVPIEPCFEEFQVDDQFNQFEMQ